MKRYTLTAPVPGYAAMAQAQSSRLVAIVGAALASSPGTIESFYSDPNGFKVKCVARAESHEPVVQAWLDGICSGMAAMGHDISRWSVTEETAEE